MHKNHKLLEPILLGDVLIKNRMICAQSLPHYLQGSESYPTETMIQYIGNLAKNGAGIIIIPYCAQENRNNVPMPDARTFPMFDYTDPCLETHLTRIAELVHFYGAKLSIQLGLGEIPNLETWMENPDTLTDMQMTSIQEEIVKRAVFFQHIGFDMVSLQMGLQGKAPVGLASMLSPRTNHRTDIYGGSVEDRSRFPLEICRAIKKRCGRSFLIDVTVIGEETGPGGIQATDTVEFAHLAEDCIDVLQIRAGNGDLAHPTGFNFTKEEPPSLQVAQAVKHSGAKILVATVGGLQDPVFNEAILEAGKVDMISMARAFICDPQYGEKIRQGRTDIVPCIRCAKCHVPNLNGPWLFHCSVNPRAGLEQYLHRDPREPREPKNVAVIGGGPAGMKAAITAAERGHCVTLFEQRDHLGGQLVHSDYAIFKWPLKAYKDYLIKQLRICNVTLWLNTKATPEGLKNQGFSHIIAALGAVPHIPDQLEISDSQILTIEHVFHPNASIGKRVVVIGGSDIGTETALYLAEHGHDVTVLTRQQRLAENATVVHYRGSFEQRWQNNTRFHGITEATTFRVASNVVYYYDKMNCTHSLEADTIIACTGMAPLRQEALEFYGISDGFDIIGDCCEIGNVQTCTRMAYAAASQV